MELDFDSREQVTDYISVPPGTYRCRVAEVRERLTRNEDTLWALRLVVAEGEFVGREAAWDNLIFSSRGLNRVKLVFRALRLPTDGKVQVAPDDLVGTEAFVTVRPSEYHAPEGMMVRRNEVPYEGYQAIPGEDDEGMAPGSEDDGPREKDAGLPF